jgi:hypothetical protein
MASKHGLAGKEGVSALPNPFYPALIELYIKTVGRWHIAKGRQAQHRRARQASGE